MSEAWTSHVLPHGALTQLAPRVWQVTGSVKSSPLPRNMTVWRMDDGTLWVHSVIALDEAGMAAIEALGTPSVMVVPSDIHRMDAPVWKERYPALRVVCAEAARAKVAKVVPVDALDTDVPGVTVHRIDGIKAVENAYEVDAGDTRALVFCDSLFNCPHQPGFGGFMLKLLGSTGIFGITRIGSAYLKNDGAAFKAWLTRMAERDDVGLLVVAHGDPVRGNVAEKLREAAGRL